MTEIHENYCTINELRKIRYLRDMNDRDLKSLLENNIVNEVEVGSWNRKEAKSC